MRTDKEALDEIALQMSGEEWGSETLQTVAEIVRETGRAIAEVCEEIPELTLLDDGTMDTVLLCTVCGEEIRYSEADRDETGCPTDEWLQACAEEHMDECEGEPDQAAEAQAAMQEALDEQHLATIARLREALALALKYLEHPDVKCLPFAVRSESAATAVRAALEAKLS